MVPVVQRPARERFERRSARAMKTIGAPALEFPAGEELRGGRARPQSELVIEPPRPGIDGLAVAFAQLVRSNPECARSEHVPHHRERAREKLRGLATPIR